MSHQKYLRHIVFLTGASGSGKTTLMKKLSEQLPVESAVFLHFDSIGVPSFDDMTKLYGSPREWQRAMMNQWAKRLTESYSDKHIGVRQSHTVFLEGQVDLMFIEAAFDEQNLKNYTIVLIHCEDAARHERLRGDRQQPELVNAEMDNWAVYLKKQAVEKRRAILDSGAMSIDEMAEWIIQLK